MSKQLILIDSPLSTAGFKSVVPMEGGPLERLQSVESYLVALAGGNQSADVTISVGAVSAQAAITCASGGSSNGQAMTLLNILLTAVASAPSVNQFVVSSTASVQAANIAAAINSSPDFKSRLVAVADNTICRVYAKTPGSIGNGLMINVGNLANVTLSQFSGGSDGDEFRLAK